MSRSSQARSAGSPCRYGDGDLPCRRRARWPRSPGSYGRAAGAVSGRVEEGRARVGRALGPETSHVSGRAAREALEFPRLPQTQSAGSFLLSVPSSLPSPRSPACVGQSSSRPWGSAWSGRVVLPSRVVGQSESLVWVWHSPRKLPQERRAVSGNWGCSEGLGEVRQHGASLAGAEGHRTGDKICHGEVPQEQMRKSSSPLRSEVAVDAISGVRCPCTVEVEMGAACTGLAAAGQGWGAALVRVTWCCGQPGKCSSGALAPLCGGTSHAGRGCAQRCL